MPRQPSAPRIERLIADAIERAGAAIDDDLERQDYDAAWAGAKRLHELLESYRAEADRQRAIVITRLADEDDRSLVYVAKRFGISRSRVSQLLENDPRDQGRQDASEDFS